MNKNILKSIFREALTPLGYIASKDTFYKKVGEIFIFVQLRKSSFDGSFWVELGIFVDEGGLLAQPPPYQYSHIMIQAQQVMSKEARGPFVAAFDLESRMKDDERKSIILNTIENYVVPCLNSLSTIEGIAHRLDPNKGNVPLATLMLKDIVSKRMKR